MIFKSLQKIICVIVLTALLIPGVVSAQDNVQTYSNQTFSNEELAQMLAPVALYPDVLLSQILMAASYPFEVVEAERWLKKNPYVQGDALDEALKVKDWDVSILALCHYPKILTMMNDNLSWTARLGDAFANQQEDVLDTVQQLRAGAYAAGNLSTTKEQTVIVDERYIRIDPVDTDYIYVPAYDPSVIYGHWWYPMFPPLPIILPGLAVTGPGLFFSPRFYVGFGVFGWSLFDWREHNIIVVNIDRTRRFNRHLPDYRDKDHHPWRPDRDRRGVRERRGGEIPRFHPPDKPAPREPRLDRRPGGNVILPDRRKGPEQPRGIDRGKHQEQPRIGDRDKSPDVNKPGIIGKDKRPQWNPPEDQKGRRPDRDPRIIDRDKTTQQDRRIIEKDKRIEQPRIVGSDKMRPPDPKIIERSQPVTGDRGKVEVIEPRKTPSLFEQKGSTGADRVRERDTKSNQRPIPGGEIQNVPQRSMERGGMSHDR